MLAVSLYKFHLFCGSCMHCVDASFTIAVTHLFSYGTSV